MAVEREKVLAQKRNGPAFFFDMSQLIPASLETGSAGGRGLCPAREQQTVTEH